MVQIKSFHRDKYRRYAWATDFDPKFVFFPFPRLVLTSPFCLPRHSIQHHPGCISFCSNILILPAPPPHAKERNEKEKAEGPGRRLTSEQVERVPGDNLHLCGKDKEKLKRTWVFLFWVFFFGAGCEGGELGRGGRLIEIWSKRVEEEREREKGGISSSARVERRSHSKKEPALTFFTEISLEKDQDPSRRVGPCSNQNSR